MFNVIDFGAKGDGSTDDTTAIQRAIDAASQNVLGGTVFFPEGTYKISDTIEINTNGIVLLGDARNSTIIASYITDNNAVQFLGSTKANLGDCGFRNLQIEQMNQVSSSNSSATLLYAKYVFQFRVENIRLWGASGDNNFAQRMIFTQGTSVYLDGIDAVGAVSCGIECYGEVIDGTLYGNDYMLSNITVNMNGDTGNALSLNGVAQGAVETVNCNFLTGEQCSIVNTDFAVFTNTYFDSAQKGVLISGDSTGISFSNCWFSNRPGGGIIIDQAENIVLNNCLVMNNGGDGIHLTSQSTGIIISNSLIDSNNTTNGTKKILGHKVRNKGSGVYIEDGATNIQIVGNRIGDTTKRFSGHQNYGVYIDDTSGDCNNIMVTLNNFTNNKIKDIHGYTTIDTNNMSDH